MAQNVQGKLTGKCLSVVLEAIFGHPSPLQPVCLRLHVLLRDATHDSSCMAHNLIADM